MNMTDNDSLRTEIDRLTGLWIEEKNKINKVMRALDRIAGMCGAAEAAGACRNILKECKRIKSGIEPSEKE
jgi:hypothetical protein